MLFRSKKIAIKHFANEPHKVSGAVAKLFPFGSYTLGVMATTSDIDCICVTPKYVKRKEHFFGDLKNIFEKHSHVTDLTTVYAKGVKVPLIKLKFEDVEIDLAFANLNRENI